MNVNSRLVRWAYWLDRKCDGSIPRRTNLCVLFWRTVLLTPLALLLIAATSPVWVPIYLLAHYIILPLMERLPAGTADEIEDKLGIVGDYLGAAKTRVCPIIEIERPQVSSYRSIGAF